MNMRHRSDSFPSERTLRFLVGVALGLVIAVPTSFAILSPHWLSVVLWSVGGGVIFGTLLEAFGGSFLSHVVDLLSNLQL